MGPSGFSVGSARPVARSTAWRLPSGEPAYTRGPAAIAGDGRGRARLAAEIDRAQLLAVGHVEDVELAVAAGDEGAALGDGQGAVDRALRLELPAQLAVLGVQAVERLVVGGEQDGIA